MVERPLPGWPAVLHEEWAAAYLSVSATTFRQQIAPQVPPIRLTQKRIGWVREHLDRWIAQQAGEMAGVPEINPWNLDDDDQPKAKPRRSMAPSRPEVQSAELPDGIPASWIRPPARNYPVSILERKLLAHLRDGPPAELPKGVSVGTVDRLEDRGWIEQAEKHTDCRRDKYVLTEAGKAAWRELLASPR